MIKYQDNLDSITPEMLTGFFVGWPNPPSPVTHYNILTGSSHIVLAIDDETGQVVGFINAISDNVLSAYIPLLEVLPDYQKQGIGKELVDRMMDNFKNFYMVDLVCDKDMEPFYKKCNFSPALAMMIRNFDHQNGL